MRYFEAYLHIHETIYLILIIDISTHACIENVHREEEEILFIPNNFPDGGRSAVPKALHRDAENKSTQSDRQRPVKRRCRIDSDIDLTAIRLFESWHEKDMCTLPNPSVFFGGS